MSKKMYFLISILVLAAMVLSSCGPGAGEEAEGPEVQDLAIPTEDVVIRLWTKEGEADGGLQFVKSLTDAFTAQYPNITFEVLNKDVETLREDFQTSSLAGDPPELLWTVNDHAGPFTAAQLIQPVEPYFDMSLYVPSVVMDGHTWGVPISSGNHLMLLYNKDLIAEAPKTTEELIALKDEFSGDVYALVYNATEPFWLVPWLGGFGGSVFAEDGVTPTLDTPDMVETLKFLYDLEFTHGIVPSENDYDSADALFKEGKAAMIVNGDWTIGGYSELFGDKLGIAPIPETPDGWPAPYTSGTYFMIPKNLDGAKLAAVVNFIEYVMTDEVQTREITELKRLPGSLSALESDLITNDPLLSGSAAQMAKGVPMPSVLEMRCNWDSMKPEMQAVLSGTKSPEDAAAAMQASAELCIEDL
ncbi:MAG: extracellular solute-binding protein [Anaerolineales bacterium]|nr:extracellular solute-binding protein [Anaerolineales bacterium]